MYNLLIFTFFIVFSGQPQPNLLPMHNGNEEITNDSLIAYLTGHFEPSEHPEFLVIPSHLASRSNLYLRKEALDAYLKMYEAARAEGIYFKILSATRNFDYQKGIWEAKWTGKRLLSNGENARTTYSKAEDRALKILEYSSMPGTSRHHWGTDIDLNAFNNAYFERGKGKRELEWLEKNGPRFGFYRPYTTKGNTRPTGYEEERWHWSYYPIAAKLTEAASELLKDEDIAGFQGAEAAAKIEVVKRYVLGVATPPVN